MLKRLALIALLIASSSSILAQYDNQKKERSPSGSRDTRFEASLLLAYQNSVDEETDGGSGIDVDSQVGWGFSIGWNWTSRWNLQYRLAMNEPDYVATVVPENIDIGPQSIEHTMTKYSHQFNVTYNFSEGAFTPFVLAGLGYTKLDTNVPSAPPNAACWWDPWWGYICISDWRTYSTSELSYNLGIGFRWDINNAVFTRASYTREFLSLDNGDVDFDMAVLEVGLMF